MTTFKTKNIASAGKLNEKYIDDHVRENLHVLHVVAFLIGGRLAARHTHKGQEMSNLPMSP